MKRKIPSFKYNPMFMNHGVTICKKGVCNCCGNATDIYICTMYSIMDIDCICLECVKSGAAAEKFDGSFIQTADYVEDKEKRDELFNRTPGYSSWQGENWKACCDDYCEYLGEVGYEEIIKMNIKDQLLMNGDVDSYINGDISLLVKGGSISGYLFRCLHCKKYYLRVDGD